jgi:hypothetical protein
MHSDRAVGSRARRTESFFMVKNAIARFAAVASVLLTICMASAAIIEQGKGPEDIFLRKVWRMLDLVKVDVVVGSASALETPEKPRLAALKGYAPKAKDWGSFAKAAWPFAFAEGHAGVMFAYRPGDVPKRLAKKKADCDRTTPPEEVEACRFVKGWLGAEPEDRVFIAFTKEDFDSAAKVKSALEKSGYVVFMFLKGKNEQPWASPALVGEVFAQATHRLVIDTAAARGSPGVRFESLCCEPLLMPPYPATKWSRAIAEGK